MGLVLICFIFRAPVVCLLTACFLDIVSLEMVLVRIVPVRMSSGLGCNSEIVVVFVVVSLASFVETVVVEIVFVVGGNIYNITKNANLPFQASRPFERTL